METTETLSKKEYQYLKNIEKLELLTEKLEAALEKEKAANLNLKKENEELKAELEETVTECQKYIDDADVQMDEMEKKHGISSSGPEKEEKVVEESAAGSPEKEKSFTDRIFNR